MGGRWGPSAGGAGPAVVGPSLRGGLGRRDPAMGLEKGAPARAVREIGVLGQRQMSGAAELGGPGSFAGNASDLFGVFV